MKTFTHVSRLMSTLIMATVIAASPAQSTARGMPEGDRAAGNRPAEASGRYGEGNQSRDGAGNAERPATRVQQRDQPAGRDAAEQRAESYEREQLALAARSTAAAEQQARAGLVQGWLGGAAALLLFITLWYTRRTAQEAKRSADAALNAVVHAGTSAQASVRSAEAAENATERAAESVAIAARGLVVAEQSYAEAARQGRVSLRPMLWLHDFGRALDKHVLMEEYDYEGPAFLVLPVVKNTGRTPARNVRIMAWRRLGPSEDRVWQEISDRKGIIIGIDQTIVVLHQHIMLPTAIALYDGDKSLSLRFRMEYTGLDDESSYNTEFEADVTFTTHPLHLVQVADKHAEGWAVHLNDDASVA
jgi:hypothetical protein